MGQNADLIRAAKSGNDRAIGILYETYRSKGISIARQYVKTPEDAEDMYQDSFLKAMEHLDSFDESRDFGPWLNTIIVNTCKNWLVKKKAVNFSDMSDDETEFVDTLGNKDESVVPDLSYDRKEFMNIIGDIINELPQAQREACTLFYYKEMSIRQIAEFQNVPEDTVKSRLNYSRKKVGTAVEEYERRTGIKLHGILLVPLLALFFKRSVYAAEAGSMIAGAAKTAVTGAAVAKGVGAGAKTVSAERATGYVKRKTGALAIRIAAGLIGASATVGAVHAVTTSRAGNSIERVGHVSDPGQLDPKVLKSFKKIAEPVIHDYVRGFANTDYHKAKATDPKYEGMVVMNPKDPEKDQNRVILVYSVDWRPRDGKAFNESRIYYPYSFDGVDLYGNGDTAYHSHRPEYQYKNAINYMGTAIWGYDDPVYMYTDLVRDKAEDYTATPDGALKRLVQNN